MTSVKGRVALCTGAGRPGGLGEAILARLADDGCRVVVTDAGAAPSGLDPGNLASSEDVARVAAGLRAAGAEVLALALDVTDEAQVESAIARTVETFGRLDILANNAGIGFLMQSLLDTTADRWRAVLDVNLTGAFLCTRHAARQMIRQGGGGRIVNIASQAAKSGHMHMAAYTASKHGMVGLTRAAALELRPHGITVNAVCPGTMSRPVSAVSRTNTSPRCAGFRHRPTTILPTCAAGFRCAGQGCRGTPRPRSPFSARTRRRTSTGEAMNVSGGIEMH